MDQLTAVSEFLKQQADEERAEQSAAQISLIACQIAAGSIKVSVKSVVSFCASGCIFEDSLLRRFPTMISEH